MRLRKERTSDFKIKTFKEQSAVLVMRLEEEMRLQEESARLVNRLMEERSVPRSQASRTVYPSHRCERARTHARTHTHTGTNKHTRKQKRTLMKRRCG